MSHVMSNIVCLLADNETSGCSTRIVLVASHDKIHCVYLPMLLIYKPQYRRHEEFIRFTDSTLAGFDRFMSSKPRYMRSTVPTRRRDICWQLSTVCKYIAGDILRRHDTVQILKIPLHYLRVISLNRFSEYKT